MQHEEPSFPSPRTGWLMVGVFFLISIVSVLDRGVLALFVDQVRHDLVITDVQIGLLQGIAFSLFYSLVGIPMGLLADRTNRRNLIIIGVCLWSAATIAGAFAGSFHALCAARMLVGLGEAMLSPAVFSMISDMFPPQARARPISVFLMGQALASGLAITIIGFLLRLVTGGHLAGLPALMQAAPWRAVFAACGALGFVLLPVMLMLREPIRRTARGDENLKPIRFAETLAGFWQGRSAFLPLYIGFSIVSVAAYGFGAWLPAVLQRSYGLSSIQLGNRLGIAIMIAGITGALAGGQIADLLARRGVKGGKMLLGAAACWLALPAAFCGFAPNGNLAILMSVALNFCYPAIGVCITSTATELAPPRMRGTAISVTGLFNGLVGGMLGPYVIGLLTDHWFHDPLLLYRSFAIVCASALILGGSIFVLTWWNISRRRIVEIAVVQESLLS